MAASLKELILSFSKKKDYRNYIKMKNTNFIRKSLSNLKVVAVVSKSTLIALLLICNQAYGESYSDVTTVKGLSIGTDYVRVQLDSMKQAEGCPSVHYYYLDTSDSKNIYSALLSAKLSNQQLSLQLTGCDASGKMAKISHLYMCDKQFCI